MRIGDERALISLCLFVFYFVLFSVVGRSLALKAFANVFQLFTISQRCVCMCFRLAIGISQLSARWTRVNGNQSSPSSPPPPPRLSHPALHPSLPSSLLQSSAEPSPVWSSDQDDVTASVIYLRPVTPYTNTQTHTQMNT